MYNGVVLSNQSIVHIEKEWLRLKQFLTEWGKDLNSIPVGPLSLIAMPGCEELGEKINNWLQKWNKLQEVQDEEFFTVPGANRDSFLMKAYCPRFGTGESKGTLKESVRGYDVYILIDVCAYNKTYKMYGQEVPMSPDDHFQDLKRIIAAIGGKAKRVNVIMPMLYESRQHRRTSRESLDCAMGLQELENMGVDNIITFDAHDPRVQNAIPLIGFENVMPTYQMIKALCKSEKELDFKKENMMVVSPDEGALKRNIYYASVMGVDLGMFYKRRDYTTVVNGRNPIIAHEYLGDSVEGKDILVVDDMIASGDSILDLCKELKKRKANRIFAAATFAFFTNGIEAFNKAYEEGYISRVIATNLTYRRPEVLSAPWFVEADMSKYISYIIATLNHDRSLHDLLNPYDKIKAHLAKYHEDQMAAGIRLV
ncbi:MAG: ribose-phosphate pyrophosphokinase [Clostridia bacterium]|nr:ribose-phosphate pyrophosphokinase [Clostridia bacterium]